MTAHKCPSPLQAKANSLEGPLRSFASQGASPQVLESRVFPSSTNRACSYPPADGSKQTGPLTAPPPHLLGAMQRLCFRANLTGPGLGAHAGKAGSPSPDIAKVRQSGRQAGQVWPSVRSDAGVRSPRPRGPGIPVPMSCNRCGSKTGWCRWRRLERGRLRRRREVKES